MKRDALFCYDLELPISFVPKPMDGEVESFELQTLDWVLHKIVEGGPNGYKPNCNVVIIDFLIRSATTFFSAEARRRGSKTVYNSQFNSLFSPLTVHLHFFKITDLQCTIQRRRNPIEPTLLAISLTFL